MFTPFIASLMLYDLAAKSLKAQGMSGVDVVASRLLQLAADFLETDTPSKRYPGGTQFEQHVATCVELRALALLAHKANPPNEAVIQSWDDLPLSSVTMREISLVEISTPQSFPIVPVFRGTVFDRQLDCPAMLETLAPVDRLQTEPPAGTVIFSMT